MYAVFDLKKKILHEDFFITLHIKCNKNTHPPIPERITSGICSDSLHPGYSFFENATPAVFWERQNAMHGAGVVPHYEVADFPFVAIDVLRLGGPLPDFGEEQASRLVLHVHDIRRA